MKQPILFLFFAICVALAGHSCKKQFSPQQIVELEQAMGAQPTPGKVDSLLALYAEAVKADPDKHAANLQYLSKAATLLFAQKKDGNGAAKLLDEALTKHGQGQDLADAVGLYARILQAFTYHGVEGKKMDAEAVVNMNAHLGKNLFWIDSSLARLDRQMGSPVVTAPGKATAFVETAVGYATLMEQKNPDKYVDLMLKAAGLAKTIDNPVQSVQLYGEVAERMPKHHKAPMALFMTGFVYENDLMDLKNAKASYESFLKRYPNDPDFADDAQMALKMLGKSPEEIIKAAGNAQ